MKHPAIIASVILAFGMLISAALISSSLHSLGDAITRKPVGTVSFPSELSIRSGSPIHVTAGNYNPGGAPQPFIIQSKQ